MTTFRYSYATQNEVIADLGIPGSSENVLERFILPATQYLVQEIGQFIPTSEIRRFAGNGKQILYIDPVLSISQIWNDETMLTTTDYQLEPVQRMWQDGPYIRINCGLEEAVVGYWIPKIDAIQITGTWGLFDRSAKTGAALGSTQLVSAETLTVDNGSLVCPGMVLLIGSEAQFVTGIGAVTSAVTTLSAGCTASDDILTLASTTGLNVGEIIRVGFEQCKILDKSATQVNVVRGWNGTGKTDHATSTAVDVYRTFTVERAVNGSTAAQHASADLIWRYKVPDDVNYLARQIAALMLKKSQTGFAGRAGSAETGESFYIHEFPKDAIARVRSNYYIPSAR